jgi:hypothetical protein
MRHKFINDFNKHSTINRLDISKGQYCDGSTERKSLLYLRVKILFVLLFTLFCLNLRIINLIRSIGKSSDTQTVSLGLDDLIFHILFYFF